MSCWFPMYINTNQSLVIHVPTLLNLPPTSHPIPPLWVVTKPQDELPVLHSNFPLAIYFTYARMHAKSLQSCPTLCDHVDSSPPGSSVHRILQARILEWVAISFSNFTYGNVYTSMLLSQFVPPSPAPAVSKGLFSVSLFMSSNQVQVNFFSVFHRYTHPSRANSRTLSSHPLATTPLSPHCSLQHSLPTSRFPILDSPLKGITQ